MSLIEFNKLLESTGYKVAFRHFPKEEIVSPPFICYITPSAENYSADNKVYYKDVNIQVELYTNDKDILAEQKVETVLADFYYEKDEIYIESERMYMVVYELTL